MQKVRIGFIGAGQRFPIAPCVILDSSSTDQENAFMHCITAGLSTHDACTVMHLYLTEGFDAYRLRVSI